MTNTLEEDEYMRSSISDEKDAMLFEACLRGDFDCAKKALQNGADRKKAMYYAQQNDGAIWGEQPQCKTVFVIPFLVTKDPKIRELLGTPGENDPVITVNEFDVYPSNVDASESLDPKVTSYTYKQYKNGECKELLVLVNCAKHGDVIQKIAEQRTKDFQNGEFV